MLKIPSPVTSLPFRESEAEQELIFRATIPALGFTSYYVTKTDEPLPPPASRDGDGKFKIANNVSEFICPKRTKNDPLCFPQKMELVFDPETGLLKSILRKDENNVTYEDMGQNFYYYKSKTGDVLDGQKSGAYIFRPDGDAIAITDNVELESFSGENDKVKG
jgi:Glycosyl hydrolases family 38 C-terminal domain